MSRLQDVARQAGVSAATVSRVINGNGYVSPDLKNRVVLALRELDYVPYGPARSLRTHKTYTLGFLTTDLRNPFLGEVAHAIETTANASGYSVIICASGGNFEVEARYMEMLGQARIEGLLANSLLEGSLIVDRLARRLFPFVLVGRRIRGLAGSFIGEDNWTGVKQSVDYLCDLGHRRIGYIRGDLRSSIAHERLAGYMAGLAGHDLRPDPALVMQGNYEIESGYEAADKLFASSPAPTAIVAGNDRMAYGAWRWLTENGLRVPDDVSLVGYDDVEFAALGPIRLTTVHSPKQEMGEQAVAQLIKEINGQNAGPVEIILPARFMIRDTCAPPRGPGAKGRIDSSTSRRPRTPSRGQE